MFRSIFFVVLCVAFAGCSRDNPTSPTAPLPPLVPASELSSTDIFPYASGTVAPGRNYVYCATFELAWNALRESLDVESIEMEGAGEFAERLNVNSFGGDDLDADSYLAIAGRAADGVEAKIRSAMRSRFPNATLGLSNTPTPDDALIAFAYLQKSLGFQEKFDRSPEPLEFESGGEQTKVASFGVESFVHGSERNEQLMKQVTVLDYASDDDFIIRLETTSRDDAIILAKLPPAATLEETIDKTLNRIDNSNISEPMRKVQVRERLAAPIVSFGVTRDYSELVGKKLMNPGLENWFVAVATQSIKFRLDETGARLESSAEAAAASEIRAEPRQFVFNKPFLVMLKRTGGTRPYLAIWVANPEILEPFEN